MKKPAYAPAQNFLKSNQISLRTGDIRFSSLEFGSAQLILIIGTIHNFDDVASFRMQKLAPRGRVKGH